MKPKDPIWNFYSALIEDKKTSVRCLYCNAEVSAKVLRLKSHREKCPGLLKSKSKSVKRCHEELTNLPTPPTEPTDTNEQPPSKKPKLQQRSASNYGVSTDSNMWEQLDEQTAKLFYACNLPFIIADHPVWRQTVEMLRHGYHPPNRKDIGGPLLDKTHEKLTTTMKTQLEGEDVVMMKDGWSDIHNTPVIATSLHSDGAAYFLSVIDTGTNKKTAAYCTSVAQDAIKEAKEVYGCHVTAMVTDNEKKMEVMKQNLKDIDPDLTAYGCSAHWLNLLGQDITPFQVINQVVEVNKYFQNHHVPGALLSEMSGSVKPQLQAETRWNSQLKRIETFVKNRPFMVLIVAQNEDLIDTRIRNLIHKVGLFNEVKHLQSQLQPISSALDKLQSDSATIADACEEWLDLLKSPDLEPYSDKIHHRFQQAMTPDHFLANLLHPVYRGKKLDPSHVTSAQEKLLESNPDAVPDLLDFMTDSVALPKALMHEAVITD